MPRVAQADQSGTQSRASAPPQPPPGSGRVTGDDKQRRWLT